MPVTLVVRGGSHEGREIAIHRPKFLIGRAEDCQLRPRSDLVSRYHCAITVEEGFVGIRDFGSRNGTFVNGEPVAGERMLRSGDLLKVGHLRFEVRITTVVSSTDRIVESLVPASAAASGIRSRVLDKPFGSVRELAQELREAIQSNHLIFCPCGRKNRIQKALLQKRSAARRILSKGFHRMVVLDTKRGVDADGKFDLATFYAYAFTRLLEDFQLDLPDSHHEQDIIQILRDEQNALLCLLNVDLVPFGDLSSLRSLTQEKHQTLIVYRAEMARKPRVRSVKEAAARAAPIDDLDAWLGEEPVPNRDLERRISDTDCIPVSDRDLERGISDTDEWEDEPVPDRDLERGISDTDQWEEEQPAHSRKEQLSPEESEDNASDVDQPPAEKTKFADSENAPNATDAAADTLRNFFKRR